MKTQSDYELAAEDILNDKVKAIGFDEVLQCLNHGDTELDHKLALFLIDTSLPLIYQQLTVEFMEMVNFEGLINAIHSVTDEDDNLNKTFEELMNTHESQQILIDRALVVYETEIENRLGV